MRQLKQTEKKSITMRFDHGSGDLELIWNTFLDFEAFTREADGDLNYFIEEWKEKMVRVQSAGCQYSDLLLGLKLMEKVNLSSDSIMSLISKLGSSHSNSDSFLAQVVTNLKAERAFDVSSVDDATEKNNQSGPNIFNQEISDDLEMKSNLVSCSHCPVKFFDAVSLSKHYQEFHPGENKREIFHSAKEFKPDPGLLKCSKCDKNFLLKEDLKEHQKNHEDAIIPQTVVQVWIGSSESNEENSKDDPLLHEDIKMEIMSDINFKYDMKSVRAENEYSEQILTNSTEDLKCSICQKEFISSSNLILHMDTHKTSVDFTCYLCGKAHQTKTALYGHVKREHRKKRGSSEPTYGTRKFPCEICGRPISHSQKGKHMTTHFRDPIKCSICEKEFSQLRYLRVHMDSHKTTKDFMCSHCGMRFQKRQNLYFHKSYHHKKDNNNKEENQCEAVPSTKSDKKEFNPAFKTEGINDDGNDSMISPDDNLSFVPENKIACETCGKYFAKTSIRNHRMRHTKQSFMCNICQKEFNLPDYLRTHMKTHKTTKDHICSYCGNAYKGKLGLNKHMLKKHGKKATATKENAVCKIPVGGQCEICGQIVEGSQMKDHMKTHQFECNICQKNFKTSSHLKQHLGTHNTTNEYICSFCGKKYKTKLTLYEHMNRHTKGRPLPCKFCNKIFFTHGSRTFHIRAHHTGEKPYKCDICDKRFYISSRKIQHMRYHTGEKPYQCHICGKYFKEGTTRKRHIRNVHKEVQLDDL